MQLVAMRRIAVVGLSLFAAGCGGLPAAADSSRVDMCTILSDPELRQLSVTPSSRTPVNRESSVGCEWAGKAFILSLERDAQMLASYKTRPRPAFISFAENTVNGRPAARVKVDRDGMDCEQLMDGGPVSLVISVAPVVSASPSVDSCAEALRIARMIEPRLPKADS